jgi:HEAT repeat protein
MNDSIRTLALGTALFASAATAQDRGGEVPGLLITLKSEKAAERAGSARTLGEIGPAARDAVAALSAALKDGDKDVRRSAAQALGDIGPASASGAGALTAALKDPDWHVRRAAAYALGRLGTRDVEPALKAARKDKQEAVRNAAKASLEQIKKLPKPQKMKTLK